MSICYSCRRAVCWLLASVVIGFACVACGSDAEQGNQSPSQQSDAGVIIGWIYDGEQGCLEQASPEVERTDDGLLVEQTPTIGPGGVCWVLPRSQLPREGWTEIDPFDLPDSCPDLMDIPYCGPFCPHDRFHGQRYDEERQCLLEREELWCRPVNAGGGDAETDALAPDGTCWRLPGTQMPSKDWTNLDENPSDVCPDLIDVVECGAQVDAGTVVVDGGSGPFDGGVNVYDAMVGLDATMTNADAAIGVADAAHD